MGRNRGSLSTPVIAAGFLLAVGLFSGRAAGAQSADPPPRPLRFPDIHHDFVVFSYAGDIWRAPTSGGEARRLTAHEGLELFPKISPDGRWVAFSAEHTGTRQVYVMPAEGGASKQLTFYGDVGPMPPRGGWDYWVLDFTSEGKILVRCNRTPWGVRMGRYCMVDPAGGLETYLELPEGGGATLSPDGKKLAYTPVAREFRTWKRTRGGRAQDVWIFDLEAHKSERVTTNEGTDHFPMWSGETIYFTSDREETLNLFAYHVARGDLRQVTDFDTWDVLWPALGPRAIVFLRGGHLWRFDLATEKAERISITIASELPHAQSHFRDVSQSLATASFSPSASRVIFEARGELFSVPRKKGPTRNLTRTQGVRETAPAWSPDGRWLAYFSDATGEYELYVRPPGYGSEARRLTSGGEVWLHRPVWSPDSSKIAWSDRDRRLRFIDVSSGEITEVARGVQETPNFYAWSPDSRWLVYQTSHPNRLPGIAVYSLAARTSALLGDGWAAEREPIWSADGHYLFFLSERDYNLRFSSFEFNYLYDRATRIYAAAVDPDAPPLFAFESDEEMGQGTGSDDDDDDDDANGGERDPVRVTAEGFTMRTISLPGVRAASYTGLRAVRGALYYLRTDESESTLLRYDLKRRKEELVLHGVIDFDLTPDGDFLYLRTSEEMWVGEWDDELELDKEPLDLSDLVVKIDPRAEWRQMYRDGWRIVRDFFYDPKMHGLDWQSVGERYGAMVPHIGHRSELDFIFGELIGELEAGHTYVVAGDEPRVERVEGGKLGCELELDPASGRYRVSRILRGENWDAAYRSPLTEPGVHVNVGDYLLAIDGEELRHPDNPYRLLENKADRQVVLEISTAADGDGAREVVVRPIASESDLRYLDWVKSRMELVERLSGGKVGYIHLPNTGVEGNRMLQKLFYSQSQKPALLIDVRYNGGGFIPDRMIEYFHRTTISYWARRDVLSTRTPDFAHDGPKAMLINGYSSSGGDALPYYFRQAGLGPLIGTRTWGGLIGISGAPSLVDGGVVLPPTFRIYDAEGRWVVENEGVSPDIEVFDLPEAILQGGDPSIEKGVEVLLEELEKGDFRRPAVPIAPEMTE